MNTVYRGFVENINNFGSVRFITIRTHTTMDVHERVQFVTRQPVNLTRQCYVQFQGVLEPKQIYKYRSYELKNWRVIGPVHSLQGIDLKIPTDDLKRFSIMQYRKTKYHEIIVARALLYDVIRSVCKRHHMVQISTPKLNNSYTEGGSELFQVHDGYVKRYMSQSPQLYKQLAINMGFSSVYEIGYIYRAEKFKTSRHLNQTVCLDVETVHGTSYIRSFLKQLIITYSNKLKQRRLIDYVIGVDDFKQITYDQAVELLGLEPGVVLTNEHERRLVQLVGVKYVYVTAYPYIQRPFYTMGTDNFDLLGANGELCSGSRRQTDKVLLEQQMCERGISVSSWYLDSFAVGCPPSAGFGLGLDRLLALMLNLDHIKYARIFPL